MRILITNTGPWGTGSGTVADAVLAELSKMGHEVLVFFPDTGLPGELKDEYYLNPDQYHIVRFPVNIKGTRLYTFPLIIPDPNPRNYENAWTFKMMTGRELQAYFLYMYRELKKVTNRFRPDVIECQHIWAMDYVVKQLGLSYICVAHHSDQMGFRYDPRMADYALETAQDAQYIFAISEYVKKEVCQLYNVPGNKVVTIENGYNGNIFKPKQVNKKQILKKMGLPEDSDLDIITFCGKVSKTKGIDVLLKANKILQANRKVMLLIMGGGGLNQFTAEEKQHFHMENVYMLGHRTPDELAELHNIAKLSVLPSRQEGFGIAALEAMACGLPMVATRTGGLEQFIVGDLVEVEDHFSLAQGILNILSLPTEQYENLSKQAIKRAENYSWKTNVDKRLKYYQATAESGLNNNNKLITMPDRYVQSQENKCCNIF